MLDIVRSRRSALYYSESVPIFCPLDGIEPVSATRPLPDLVYVNKPVTIECLADLLRSLPYLGPSWYHRSSIEYCMRTKKLEWADLQWGITASAHYPGDRVRTALDIMEAAWADVRVQERDNPAKRSFNTMVGLWGMLQNVQITSLMSFGDAGEGLSGTGVTVCRDAFDVPGLVEYRRHTDVRTSATYRPLYDICLCAEHTRLAQAYQAIKSAFEVRYPPEFVCITVDGL
eukprot:10445637-Karenia_brevis.AAC.1